MTASREELLALAGRVEGLAGPDREVDALIHFLTECDPMPDEGIDVSWIGGAAVGARVYRGDHRFPGGAQFITRGRLPVPEDGTLAKHYTASLDAAMSLVPEGWFGRVEPRFYSDEGDVRWRGYAIKPDWSRWTPHDDWFQVAGEEPAITAQKPALALTAAALRARASLTPEGSTR